MIKLKDETLSTGRDNFGRSLDDTEKLWIVFQNLRSYAIHEDELVNIRTSWFLSFTAFLWAVVAAVLNVSASTSPLISSAHAFALLALLAVFGFLVAVLTAISVRAAYCSITHIKNLWRDVYEPHHDDGQRVLAFPHIAGGGPGKGIVRRGMLLSIVLPYVSAACWIAVFLLAVSKIIAPTQ